MKKLLVTVLSFFCLENVLFAETVENQLIDEIVSQVNTEELRLIVEQLSGEAPLEDGSFIHTRQVGTEGKERAADYITQQYSEIENLVIKKEKFNPLVVPILLQIMIKPIMMQAPQEVRGELQEQLKSAINQIWSLGIAYGKREWGNIITVLKGETKLRIFTTAHYDSAVFIPETVLLKENSFAPGADDNATGVAATIIAARILSQYRFKNTIYFINVDAEEIGLVGSMSYTLQHLFGLSRIKSVINADLIGYDQDNDNLMNIVYGEDSIKDTIVNEYSRLLLDIKPVFLNIEYLNNQYEHPPLVSDHFSFYQFGVKNVVQFGEGSWVAETEYDPDEINFSMHTEEDTVENINFNYMTEIVKLYIATLAREACVIGRR